MITDTEEEQVVLVICFLQFLTPTEVTTAGKLTQKIWQLF